MADSLKDATVLLHEIENAALEIGLVVNASKTQYICYNQQGELKSIDGKDIKEVKEFNYLGSNITSTERDVQIRLGKAWAALNSLDKIWKSSLYTLPSLEEAL